MRWSFFWGELSAGCHLVHDVLRGTPLVLMDGQMVSMWLLCCNSSILTLSPLSVLLFNGLDFEIERRLDLSSLKKTGLLPLVVVGLLK